MREAPSQRPSRVLGVLCADDESRARAAARLAELGYRVVEGRTVRDLLEGRGPDPEAILYHPEGPEPWHEPLERAVSEAGDRPVVFVSRRRDPQEAIETLKLGAREYLTQSLDTQHFRNSLEEAIRAAPRPERSPAPQRTELDLAAAAATAVDEDPDKAFITTSPQMEALRKTATRLADSDVTVLIRGESGVGKEVLANHIHQHSARVHGPFVKVNCAALPEQLLESELFGFEQGAFTGAMVARQGKFELARGGTILLDEIAEMRVSLQAKLLHVLQDGVFTRLGGREEIRSDVRVLSATNRNLEKEIEGGTFREDLYFRLKVIDLVVPPLRDRREDILPLIHHFLRRYSNQYSRPMPELSYQFLQRLIDHPWPGNVRELSNLTKGLVILNSSEWAIDQLDRSRRDIAIMAAPTTTTSETTAPEQPPAEPQARAAPISSYAGRPREERPGLLEVGREAAAQAEKVLILDTLEETRWNRRRAAGLLKVSYKTLLNKIKEYELTADEVD
ncbi:MAG: sigma-54 dependent transcriptional regulator [Acidobacteriota bacterium]